MLMSCFNYEISMALVDFPAVGSAVAENQQPILKI